ncbi:chaperone modulatory protein CbpM [Rhizobium leguminosarum]|nr:MULTISPECIES: chaperone modulator CbpM [Rhizobium]MBB5662733.1 chaperone modulatory protein CbpM [Rhizobium leguminosarum]
MSGLQQKALLDWIEAEWLRPRQTRNGWRFSVIDLMRAKLILDLHDQMGVNDEGIGVILHLVDQIHGLRRALRGTASATVRGVSNSPLRATRPRTRRAAE